MKLVKILSALLLPLALPLTVQARSQETRTYFAQYEILKREFIEAGLNSEPSGDVAAFMRRRERLLDFQERFITFSCKSAKHFGQETASAKRRF